MLAGFEGGVNIAVHIDREVLLLHDLIVSCLDSLVHPVPEWCTHDGVDYVCQVGTWKLFYLSGLHRKCFCYCWPLLCVVEHQVHGQAFKVRDANVFDIATLDGSSLTCSKVLAMPIEIGG